MGIASFVIGLICLILSPFLSIFLILPSILALILGIVDTVIKSKKKQPKGLSIAGIVLSTIALAICILIVVFAVYVYNNASDAISNSLSNLEDEIKSELQAQEINCNVGESATLGDVKVTLTSVDKDFKDYYSFASVEDGCKILKANFEFENFGDYTEHVSSSDFECYADKFSCDRFSSVENGYFSESIAVGKKAAGSIYFEVPSDSKDIEIEFDDNAYSDGKIIFNID